MGPELDLRPQLERLDRLMLRSAGLDPGALTFAFRPLWQLDAASAAAIALQKAQATQIYAGLGLWPAEVTARLVEAQLVQDGTYPSAAAVFAEAEATADAVTDPLPVADLSATVSAPWANEPRDPDGRWTAGGGTSAEPAAPDISDPPPDAPGPHAPDGTPIALAASRKGGRRGWVKVLGSLVGEVERVLRRYLPEGEDVEGPASPSEATPAPEPGPDKADPRAAQKLDNALSDYQTRRYTIGNQTFQLDKPGMQHILERHAPDYWNGREARTQTFLPRKMSIGEIQDIVGDVLSQNRDKIIADQNEFGWDLAGTRNGVRYNVTTYKGRITRLVPLP